MHITAVPYRAALAATLLLSCPLAAQSDPFDPTEYTRIRIAAGAPAEALTAAVTGHFTGMHVRDAIVLAGTTPILVTAPGVLRSAVQLPAPNEGDAGFDRTDVRAIATVPGCGREGLDALAVVTGAGLWLWSKVPDYTDHTAQYEAVLLSTQAVWAGVKRLRTGDVDGDGIADILGLQANDTTIRCMLVKPLATVGSWPQWTLPTQGRVYDFLVADVIPGHEREVVVLNGAVTSGSYPFGGGLRLFEPGVAAPLQSVALPTSGGALAAAADSTGTWVFAAGRLGGVDQLVVFGCGATGLVAGGAGSMVALAGEPVAIAAGSWRDPANLDAVITLAAQPNPVVVPCLGGLLLGGSMTVPISTLSAPVDYRNVATPILADFHGDPAAPPERQGRPRLLYPVENLGAGQPGAIAMQLERTWPVGHVHFGGLRNDVGLVQGVPTSGLQPTRVAMASWELDSAPTAPADRKANTNLLDATTTPLVQAGPGGNWYTSLDTPEGATSAWQLIVRFECDHEGQVVRWPARTAIAMKQVDSAERWRRVTETLSLIYGTGLALTVHETPILFGGASFWGIIGDVTQPGGGGCDTKDDEGVTPVGPGG